jgi:flagellar hook-length control protein FliK
MMMQSVPTQALSIINRATGSANSTKRSRESDFEMFLGNSIKRETINENNARTSSKDKEKIISTVEDNNTKKSDASDVNTQKVEKLSDDSNKPLDQIDPELAGQILAMLGQIRNAIMKELELTPKELDQMMEDLDLDLTDFADSQAIMQLVLADSGVTDPLAMLLDEQLGDTFQSLLATVNDIKFETFPRLSEDEINQMLEQSIDSDNSEALIDFDETELLNSLANSRDAENESGEIKNNKIKFQVVTDDSDFNDRSPGITTKDDSDLSGTKDHKEGFDKTDETMAFLDKLGANYEKPLVEFTSGNVRLYDIREIAQQIIEQIRVVINPEQTTMELQLNPEHLGKVNLTISSKDGMMTAHFVVQNELAKEAVEGQMITLKETLDQQGIKVESIDVTVASYTFDQKGQSDEANQMMQKKQNTGHKITFEEAVVMSEEPLNEDDTMNYTGITGYTIDYTA